MSNPIFNALFGQRAMPQPSPQIDSGQGNIFKMAQKFKSNPLGFLLEKRMNIPANISNDPNAMLDYLLSTGQISQSQIDLAKQQMTQYGFNNSK